MDPIMICFIMSAVGVGAEPQNVTMQCPQVAQEEVINLFEELNTAEEDTEQDFNTLSRNSNNNDVRDGGDNDSEELPSCSEGRDSSGSCIDEKDFDECDPVSKCPDLQIDEKEQDEKESEE